MKEKEYLEEGTTEEVVCTACGWVGTESELVTDYYDSCNMSNPVAICCPTCGMETDE